MRWAERVARTAERIIWRGNVKEDVDVNVRVILEWIIKSVLGHGLD
jgi:hypothetical protein